MSSLNQKLATFQEVVKKEQDQDGLQEVDQAERFQGNENRIRQGQAWPPVRGSLQRPEMDHVV